MEAPRQVAAALRSLAGRTPRRWHRVSGGCSPAGRARVEFDDASSVFVKWAVDERTAAGLLDEWRVYGSLDGDFLPRVHGYVDEPRLLVLEDLGHCHWPPPWREGDPRRAADTLLRVHRSPPPPGSPALESHREFLSGWRRVAEDRGPFLSLGLASESWLDRALPAMLAAEAAVVLEGDDLLHFDARGDNLCFRPDGSVVLVDWNWTCVGNGALDLALLATSVHADGGPEPERLLPDDAGMAALLAGFWASCAGLPPNERAPGVRPLQRHCLQAALPWAARATGLEAPDRGPRGAGL